MVARLWWAKIASSFSCPKGHSVFPTYRLSGRCVIVSDMGSWIPEHDVVRSGRLELSVTNAAYLGVRQKWADGKRQRIEDILGQFSSRASSLPRMRSRRGVWNATSSSVAGRNSGGSERNASDLRVSKGSAALFLRQQAAAHEEARRLHAYIEAVKDQIPDVRRERDGYSRVVGVG